MRKIVLMAVGMGLIAGPAHGQNIFAACFGGTGETKDVSRLFRIKDDHFGGKQTLMTIEDIGRREEQGRSTEPPSWSSDGLVAQWRALYGDRGQCFAGSSRERMLERYSKLKAKGYGSHARHDWKPKGIMVVSSEEWPN